jgi:hypothetical protein
MHFCGPLEGNFVGLQNVPLKVDVIKIFFGGADGGVTSSRCDVKIGIFLFSKLKMFVLCICIFNSAFLFI